MIFKVSDYKAVKPTVLKIYNRYPTRLEEMCVASSIPLIVAFWFVNEEFGGFQNNIDSLVSFYNYERVEW